MRHLAVLTVFLSASISACSTGGTSSASVPSDAGTSDARGASDAGADGNLVDGASHDPGASDVASFPPGDDFNGPVKGVVVTMNGDKRVFADPYAGWWKGGNPDGGPMMVGFQTNSHDKHGWLILVAVNEAVAGKTYSCNAGADIVLSFWSKDHNHDVDYGNNVTAAKCSLTLTDYGPMAGDRVTGTFEAELDLTNGDAPVDHYSLTDGSFDLVQRSDTPP